MIDGEAHEAMADVQNSQMVGGSNRWVYFDVVGERDFNDSVANTHRARSRRTACSKH